MQGLKIQRLLSTTQMSCKGSSKRPLPQLERMCGMYRVSRRLQKNISCKDLKPSYNNDKSVVMALVEGWIKDHTAQNLHHSSLIYIKIPTLHYHCLNTRETQQGHRTVKGISRNIVVLLDLI